MPRQAAPPLQVPTLAHGSFTLSEDAAPHFTLLVFYRGLHCPICLKYLLELGRLQPAFDKPGVKVVAISRDGRDRAQVMADKLRAPALRMAYDLSWSKAHEWGLYISTSRGTTSIGIEEPPGLKVGTQPSRRAQQHPVATRDAHAAVMTGCT